MAPGLFLMNYRNNNHNYILTMLIPQQVIDGLDRAKGFDGHFNENRIPVRHRPIPEPR
jgi:hypothetical protein